jgi:hypothetical protein
VVETPGRRKRLARNVYVDGPSVVRFHPEVSPPRPSVWIETRAEVECE